MPLIEHAGKRFLFIHVPKTGGSTIERWLREIAPLAFHATGVPNCSKVNPQHYTCNDLSAYFPRDWFDFKFTVVRNPFARIESEYRMRHLIGEGAGGLGSFAPFGNWLERTFEQYRANPWILDNHIRPQVQFLGEGVHLYRLEETMQTIVHRVTKVSGLPPPGEIGMEMSSAAFQGEVVWTDYEVDLVQEFYARDFARFEYSTDVARRAEL